MYKNDPNFDNVKQITAGKFRRYSGRSLIENVTDIKTLSKNIKDIFRVVKGYKQAKRFLREFKPDVILIKGGFVGVPVGKAAKKLGLSYMTHDSDSTPGLANRLIAKGAKLHATGMPKELYGYDQENTLYTGVPVSSEFKKVDKQLKQSYRKRLGLEGCDKVIAVIGGSQGGMQLNNDFVAISGRLMQANKNMGIVHFAGTMYEVDVRNGYKKELLADELERVVVVGFVDDSYRYTGAADIVVSRASATVTAELAIQAKAVVYVPGRLAGAHQDKNAKYMKETGRAEVVEYGDSEGLFDVLNRLLADNDRVEELSGRLNEIAKPDAARELAGAVMNLAKANGK